MTGRTLTRGPSIVVLAAAGTLLLAACGLPADRDFRASSPDEIPFGLDDTTTSTSTSSTTTVVATTALATTTTVATEPVSLYFVTRGRLALVERVRPRPVEPDDALRLLLAGPLTTDQPPGLRTAVPPGTVGQVAVAEGTATVDLDPAFLEELSGQQQLLAFAQLTFTLLGRPGIGRVAFTVDGQPTDPLLPDGSFAAGSVSAESYRDLLLDPPPLPPTTTATSTTAPPPPPETAPPETAAP